MSRVQYNSVVNKYIYIYIIYLRIVFTLLQILSTLLWYNYNTQWVLLLTPLMVQSNPP